MKRWAILLYGVVTYAIMFAAFLYLFGFLANFLVPKGVDQGTAGPLWLALLINLALVAAFGVPHSVMARPGFKAWWTRIVPKTVERTTYVATSTALMILLFVAWRPMTQTIWHFEAQWAHCLMWSLYVLGICVLMGSTFVINHFDLFGLRQVYLAWRDKPYTDLGFSVTWFYKFVRHPLYVGWFMIFWATPSMTAGHLVFALGMSAYILVAIRYEERDLVKFHGQAYADYKEKTPMLIPNPTKIHDTVKEEKKGCPFSHGTANA